MYYLIHYHNGKVVYYVPFEYNQKKQAEKLFEETKASMQEGDKIELILEFGRLKETLKTYTKKK